MLKNRQIAYFSNLSSDFFPSVPKGLEGGFPPTLSLSRHKFYMKKARALTAMTFNAKLEHCFSALINRNNFHCVSAINERT